MFYIFKLNLRFSVAYFKKFNFCRFVNSVTTKSYHTELILFCEVAVQIHIVPMMWRNLFFKNPTSLLFSARNNFLFVNKKKFLVLYI